MKKDSFVVAFSIELLAALVSMGLLFSDFGAMIYPVSLALFAVVLSPFYLCLKKTEQEEKKRKLRVWITLVMALPIAAGILAYLVVVTMLFLYFA